MKYRIEQVNIGDTWKNEINQKLENTPPGLTRKLVNATGRATTSNSAKECAEGAKKARKHQPEQIWLDNEMIKKKKMRKKTEKHYFYTPQESRIFVFQVFVVFSVFQVFTCPF